MCQLCEQWGVNLHADVLGLASSDFVTGSASGGTANFVAGSRGWTDYGISSGSTTASTGGPGGVVAWSLAGAGLTDNSSGSFFEGSSVSLGSFLPFNYQSVLRSAFDEWSAVANIEFIQVEDNGGNIGVGAYPTIRIAAGYIDGASRVLGRANLPSSTPYGGDVVFDSGDSAFFSNQHNFFLVALHEIGHALGLSHEPEIPALMNPIIDTALSGLLADDMDGIRSLYGSQDYGPTTYYMPASLTNLKILDNGNSLTVIGNGLNNSIVGANAIETINGGGGDDTLATGGGLDTLIGGTGNDTYIIDFSKVIVIEDAGAGTDTVKASVDFFLGANVENLILTGSASISGYGNDLANVIEGNAGSNVLVGGLGSDALSGGGDADYLLVDGADTAIDGGAGFDSAFVQTAAPVTLDMGASSIEWVQGNAGNDVFNAASQTGAVYIYGMGGDDTLTGSAFGDYLDGGDGTDTLAGGDGADLMLGNGGSDILRGEGGDDSLIELGGDSVIDGGAGFDSLFVWSDTGVTLDLTAASIEWVQGSVPGDDHLDGAGNTVNTFLYGWGGNDVLTAGSADDYIAGGAGDDVLTGGAGNDTMIGETGFDRYVYTDTVWGADTIYSFDFNGEKLDFSAVAAIHSFSDFTTYEWDPLGLGYNSTTLFYTSGGTTSAITLIGVQTASLSDADFLFA